MKKEEEDRRRLDARNEDHDVREEMTECGAMYRTKKENENIKQL